MQKKWISWILSFALLLTILGAPAVSYANEENSSMKIWVNCYGQNTYDGESCTIERNEGIAFLDLGSNFNVWDYYVTWEITQGKDVVSFYDYDTGKSSWEWADMNANLNAEKTGTAQCTIKVYENKGDKETVAQMHVTLNVTDLMVFASDKKGEDYQLGAMEGLRLEEGDTSTLKVSEDYKGSSWKDVQWKSADPKIAKVTGKNVITALQEGKTELSATIGNVELIRSVVVYKLQNYKGCGYIISEYEEGTFSANLMKTDDSNSEWTGEIPSEIKIEYPVGSGTMQTIPVEEIDGNALADTDKTVITIPNSVIHIDNTDLVQSGDNKIKSFQVNEENEYFAAEEGVLYRIFTEFGEAKCLWLYPNQKEDVQFDIPEDVDTINGLFNNPNLKKIGIGKKLELGEFNPFLQYGTDWNDDGEPIAYSIQLIIDGQNTDAIQWAKDHNLKYSVKGDSTTRLSGSSRYETAITAADQLKDVMGIEKFENIIVADGGNYPDALTGSYLAKVKNAPILLVTGSKSQMISDYIDKNLKKGGKVYILGGEGAVSASFEKALKSNGISVKRLAGKTRYETNLEILKQAGVKDGELLICSGNGFADSLSASAAGKPILLVNEDITKEQQNYITGLSIDRFYIIGGTGAVTPKTEKSAEHFGAVKRLSGSTRYETSAAVAETFFSSECENAVLAYGQNFPDGLAGGPLAMALHGPLLLAENSAYDSVAAYVQKAGVKSLYVLGGESLISDRVVAKIIKSK